MPSMIRPRRFACAAVLAGLAGGCATDPRVVVHDCRCRADWRADRLAAVSFIASFDAHKLAGEQIIFDAWLLGRRGAIRSDDGRYETPSGVVGASRALLVHRDPQAFRDATLSIPAGELGFRQEDIPVRGVVSLHRLNGQCVFQTSLRLPVRRAEDVMPPLDRPKPDTRTCWFAKRPDPYVWPVLVGPFPSAEEAAAAVPGGPAGPWKLAADTYVWFVPLRKPRPKPAQELIGPCRDADDAAQLATMLEQWIKVRYSRLEVAPPIRLRLGTYLATPAERSLSGSLRIALPRREPIPAAPPATAPSRPLTRPAASEPAPARPPAVPVEPPERPVFP